MSRGLGAIQRGCLEVLESNKDDTMDSITIAGRVVGRKTITEAEHVSVRRALRKLAKARLVIDLGRHFRRGRRHWALPEAAAKYYAAMVGMGWEKDIPPEHRYLIESAEKPAKTTKPGRARTGRKKGK